MLKKQEKQNRIKNNENEENPNGVAGKLYTGMYYCLHPTHTFLSSGFGLAFITF